MKNGFSHIEQVYFLGIGGIGMSALARWFQAAGKQVSGYDKTSTPLTEALQREGIAIHFEDAVAQIPKEVKAGKKDTLVVLTPAIPANHLEWEYLREAGYTIKKRAEVLGMISQTMATVAVGGTHGKTTTTTMLAWLLESTRGNCTAFMGGLSVNFEGNLLLGSGDEAERMLVVEADEYDRSFLQLSPSMAVITAVDADHLDIYGEESTMQAAFAEFAAKVPKTGKVFLQADIELGSSVQAEIITYGIDAGDYRATHIRPQGLSFVFDLVWKTGDGTENRLEGMQLNMPGFHNVENAVAAMAVCLENGIKPEALKEALPQFKGIKRRFEVVESNETCTYIDDYAHHPTEIEAFIRSVKALFPNHLLLAVFQPHLYSRTRDFATGFAESLSLADELLLMDIYPARELPIPGITSATIFEQVTQRHKKQVKEGELLDEIKSKKPALVATIGAGDIDRFVLPIKEMVAAKFQ